MQVAHVLALQQCLCCLCSFFRMNIFLAVSLVFCHISRANRYSPSYHQPKISVFFPIICIYDCMKCMDLHFHLFPKVTQGSPLGLRQITGAEGERRSISSPTAMETRSVKHHFTAINVKTDLVVSYISHRATTLVI